MTAINYQWSKQYIDQIKQTYWEKDPYLCDYPSAHPFISEENLYKVISASLDSPHARFWIAKKPHPKTLRDFIIDGGATETQHGQLLKVFGPKPEEHFTRYFERMGHKRFGMSINDLQHADSDLKHVMQQIAQTLPSAKYAPRIDSFWGNYTFTPFGIHRDTASIFVMGIRGTRTYHTWPAHCFDFEKDGGNIPVTEEHLAISEKFILRPGKLFYWPSNRWHVVTSNGEPSITAQLSMHLA